MEENDPGFIAFRKRVGAFSKIDTEEKLKRCMYDYSQMLQRKEDQEYFEPIAEQLAEDSITLVYDKKLVSVFEMEDLAEGQFLFLVKPSFEPETALIISKTESGTDFLYKVLDENYWEKFYSNTVPDPLPLNRYHAQIDPGNGLKLDRMLRLVIAEAREPKAKFFTLDGVQYSISLKQNEKVISVFKHSPDEGSKSDRVIQLLLNLSEVIRSGLTKEAFAELLPRIESLMA